MYRLQSSLNEERDNFATSIAAMENRFLVEREKIKKSFDAKMELSQKELEASIDGKLSKKTQRTQIVNYMMKKVIYIYRIDRLYRNDERNWEINLNMRRNYWRSIVQ